MSAVNNFSDLDLTKAYSYSDYLLWKFDERIELIKGFILKMSPAPSLNHQRVSQIYRAAFTKISNVNLAVFLPRLSTFD